MQIYFVEATGRILRAIYDKDIFVTRVNFNISTETFEIDEIDPDNKELCRDIASTIRRKDAEGDPKYYMYDNAGTWELHDKDGWQEQMGV
ncbi:MAG: hypothetical protein GY853_13420 [PVC group bacterium]|nr:hypothetical protein [PVC group bacterium]